MCCSEEGRAAAARGLLEELWREEDVKMKVLESQLSILFASRQVMLDHRSMGVRLVG